MSGKSPGRLITIFTPSFADQQITNAQALTVKDIVARLPADEFRVVMTCGGAPDPRVSDRKNTKLIAYRKHGNAARLFAAYLLARPDIYFYPKTARLDAAIFALKRKLHLRTAIVTHVVMAINDVTGPIFAQSILESDAVFANSNYVGQTVQQRFAVRAETIYNGIDRRFFFPGPDADRDDKRQLTVLYAGSFQARKRVELVIREASRWPAVNFRLAGEGETQSVCLDLAERLGCRNVFFLGSQPQAQLGDEMRNADVFLFPSILEGHPQVLGQAAACGLPVIAMNEYHPDYVIDGQTGFLVGSDRELSERLTQLLHDGQLRHSMAAAALAHAMNFDWDRITARWAEVFREIMRAR